MFSCNFFVAATCIVLAAILFLVIYFWKQKSGLGMKPVFVGIVVFLVFAILFENIAHLLFLTLAGVQAQKISENLYLYLLYGCSMAGIFEETGRYFAFKHVLSEDSNPKTALGYGIGHGGIELLIGGIILLWLSPPEVFGAIEGILWAGERMVSLCGHVALSIIVFTAVRKNNKILFFSAILLHAIADIPIGLYKFGTINALISFILFTSLVLICCLIAKKCWEVLTQLGGHNEK